MGNGDLFALNAVGLADDYVRVIELGVLLLTLVSHVGPNAHPSRPASHARSSGEAVQGELFPGADTPRLKPPGRFDFKTEIRWHLVPHEVAEAWNSYWRPSGRPRTRIRYVWTTKWRLSNRSSSSEIAPH